MPIHINRRKDWEYQLVIWLQKAIKKPFVWGEFDCALAAGEAIAAQTGVDHTTGWRGKYTTGHGAAMAMFRRGYRDVFQVMDDVLGESLPAQQLGRGDIGGAELEDGKTLGVIWAGSLWLPAEDGLRPQPLSVIKCGWRVPECLQ